MKNLSAILVLGLALTHATAAEVPAAFVKLVGLSTVPDARCAFLLVLEANRRTLGEVVLAEGKSAGALELVAIDDQAMTVTIRNGGKESVLGFAAEGPPPPARVIRGDTGKKLGVIRFQSLTGARLLEFYSQLTARTMLQSSFVSVGAITGQGQCAGRDELVRFLERNLVRAHLQILPQGEKFAVVLPTNLALPASALWKARKSASGKNQSAASTKTGTFAFFNSELAQVLQFYGNLSGRKVERVPDLPNFPITCKTATPLTETEMLYALETVLVLNGIQLIAVDDQTVKAVSMTPPVSQPAPTAKNKTSLSK